MKSIRRYTELPFLLDFLHTKEIALLSPLSWDDKNDSYYLDAYAKAKGLSSVYALCLTEASETYHHWKVFSSGSSGMCIVFDQEKLLEWAKAIGNLQVEQIKYRTLKQMRDTNPRIEDLPFLKRQAFKDEKEFRLFSTQIPPTAGPLRLKIPMSVVDRIVMNPWLPKSVAANVKSIIKNIDGCTSLKVYRSTLVDNEAWKKLAALNA